MKSDLITKRISFSELNISKQRLLDKTNYDPKITGDLVTQTLNDLLFGIEEKLNIIGGYKIIVDQNVVIEKKQFTLDGETFFCGPIICNQLKNSETIVILAATLGDEMEKWSRDEINKGEYLKGYFIDVMASEFVEAAADLLENEISKYFSVNELRCTNRLSPGYCGWSVAEQQKLFSFLPEKFCGIKITDSGLMIPIKSVSAVIGVGKNIKTMDYPCDICDDEFCYKRRKKN